MHSTVHPEIVIWIYEIFDDNFEIIKEWFYKIFEEELSVTWWIFLLQ